VYVVHECIVCNHKQAVHLIFLMNPTFFQPGVWKSEIEAKASTGPSGVDDGTLTESLQLPSLHSALKHLGLTNELYKQQNFGLLWPISSCVNTHITKYIHAQNEHAFKIINCLSNSRICERIGLFHRLERQL
jgi:hypothetical protein